MGRPMLMAFDALALRKIPHSHSRLGTDLNLVLSSIRLFKGE